jgi:hypothetical protein
MKGSHLAPLANGAVPLSARRYKNPFLIPKGSEHFTYREEQDRLRAADLSASQQLSLIQRANTDNPAVPSLVSTDGIREQDSTTGDVQPIPPEAPHIIRQMKVHDFVSQEREIFLVQLMIERKREEMQHLEDEIQAEETRLQETHKDIDETSNQYKMTTAQAEGALARGLKTSETAAKKRMDMQKDHKLAAQAAWMIRAEIAKNRETLKKYRAYKEFMDHLVQDRADPETFYTCPEVLVEELDREESSNLFLLQQYQEAAAEVGKRVGKVSRQLDATGSLCDTIEAKAMAIPVVEVVEMHLTDGDVKYAAGIEAELAELHRLITHAYETCCGPGGNLGSLSMLKQIEKVLQRSYVQFQAVNQTFAQTIQRKKDEERLEQQRLEQQAKKDAEQKLKYDQAVERAQRPIKKRTGRPPIRRMLPNQIQTADPEKYQADANERARLEELLYGEET